TPAPHQGLRVIGMLLQLFLDGRHRALECRRVARKGAEHGIANLVVETLLSIAAAGNAHCRHNHDAETPVPFHPHPSLLAFGSKQSPLDHRVLSRPGPLSGHALRRAGCGRGSGAASAVLAVAPLPLAGRANSAGSANSNG